MMHCAAPRNCQNIAKTQQKPSKKPAKTQQKTQQNARFLDVFTHARARQCMVQKIGRGGNEGGKGKEEKEEEEEEEKEEGSKGSPDEVAGVEVEGAAEPEVEVARRLVTAVELERGGCPGAWMCLWVLVYCNRGRGQRAGAFLIKSIKVTLGASGDRRGGGSCSKPSFVKLSPTNLSSSRSSISSSATSSSSTYSMGSSSPSPSAAQPQIWKKTSGKTFKKRV